MLGPAAANGRSDEVVTFLEGLRSALPASVVGVESGVAIDGDGMSGVPAALDLVGSADIAVLCIGEAASMSGEAASRGQLGLPGRQDEFARSVLELGKPVLVLLSSGRPLAVPWLFERADAVLATWYLGSQAGHAVGDILIGRWNPSGRLPVSWPVDVGQIPVFYAQRPTGRPADPTLSYTSKYIDLSVEPLFPFGHGLSYTRFELSDLRVHPKEIRSGGTLTIDVTVSNTGQVEGEETVLLFVRDPVATLARPLLELKCIAKAVLRPGERDVVKFTLTTDDLTFFDTSLCPRLEPGLFEIFVGPNAARERLLKVEIRVIAH
jgi:beta-glucosidase